MSATLEQLEPSANGAGKIGTSTLRWGEGHFAALYVNGGSVAPLASPTFTGTPAVPTAAPGTNTTQAASTAFVTAADTVAKARANHTGTQLAATISDFDAAVTASTAGAKAHVVNADTKLATGTGNEVTAAALRTHLDDATKHRQINDAGTGATDLWSAEKIQTVVTAATAGGALAALDTVAAAQIDTDAVTTAKILAANVTTAKIADAAVTGAKVEGGTAAPGNSKYWGTSSLGAFGFHSLPTIPSGALASLDTVAAAQIDTDAVTTIKILAANVTTAKIADGAVTGAKVDGGTASPGNSKYWGTSSGGTFGFHSLPSVTAATWDTAKGTAIASTATIDLGATTGNIVDITGTTTITGLGTAAAGITRIARFTGALLLTYNATSLILPTAASITTAAGDVGVFSSLGSGNWHCVAYTRASGYPLIGSYTPAIPGAIGSYTPADGTFTNLIANTSFLQPVYTLATLPTPTGNAGKSITVSDGSAFSGGAHWDYELATCDGSGWKWASNGDLIV